MIEGISSYPKHFLLMLLSDITEMVHSLAKTSLSEQYSDKEKLLIYEETLLNKEAALLYLTINTIMEKISIDKDELRNIKAELKLHKDTHGEAYSNMDKLFAEAEIESLIKSIGLTMPDDSKEDNS